MHSRGLIYQGVIMLLAATMWSCGGGMGSGGNDVIREVVDSVDIATDSIQVIEVEPERPDSVLNHDISTAEEALQFMHDTGNWERYERGILPRIAKQSVDYTKRLLQSPYPYFIIVDKTSMRVILYDRYGVEQTAYKMNCSRKYGTKHERRDNRTPEGFFSAEGVYDSTDWLYTDDDGHTSPQKGQFGPRFIRVKNPVTTQVGIHGTCSPWSLGRRGSHGCIRVHNDSIMKLVNYVTVGMPIIINPGSRDEAVNKKEGYEITRLDLGKVKFITIDPESLDEKPKTDSVSTVVTDSVAPDLVPDSIPQSIPVEHPMEEPDSVIEPVIQLD